MRSKSDLCLLCKKSIQNQKYDIDKNHTKYSNLQLRVVLEGVLNIKIIIKPDVLMCTSCFNLLNDLDLAEINCKSIKNKIINCYKNVESNIILSDVWTRTEEIQCNVDQSGKNLNTKYGNKTDEQLTHADGSDTFNKTELNSELSTKKNETGCVTDNNKKDLQKPKTRKRKANLNLTKLYKCTHCSKTWKTAAGLKSHLSSLSETRPFICEVCGQSYKHKSALDVHVGMHNGVNPFICTYCNKSFTQKAALQRHIPIHTGETPYQCDLCGKRFVHHTSFNFHRRSHSGEKLYKCPVCSLALFSGSHLTRHMRVHTGERKFACSVCGRRFAERYNLVSHQKLHFSTEPKPKSKLNDSHKRVLLDGNLSQLHNEISNFNNDSLQVLKSDNRSTWTITPN